MTNLEIKTQMGKAQNSLIKAYSELSVIWGNTKTNTEENKKASELMDELAEFILTNF